MTHKKSTTQKHRDDVITVRELLMKRKLVLSSFALVYNSAASKRFSFRWACIIYIQYNVGRRKKVCTKKTRSQAESKMAMLCVS